MTIKIVTMLHEATIAFNPDENKREVIIKKGTPTGESYDEAPNEGEATPDFIKRKAGEIAVYNDGMKAICLRIHGLGDDFQITQKQLA